MIKPKTCIDLRKSIVGIDTKVPLIDGREKQFINFDNGASAPTFTQVRDKVDEFLVWYSNVHRGTGFKSQISSHVFDQVRENLFAYTGADIEKDTIVFGKNTTEMINVLANRLNLSKEDVVISSIMEHHSNDLPWRTVATVVHVMTDKNGDLDFDHYLDLLKKYKGKVKIVTLSAASNVSGTINDVYKFAEEAHKHGALVAVDAAQFAPHRPMDMLPHSDPRHLDFLTFASHKMYAPYGIGVLIGNFDELTKDVPYMTGGGTVKIVTLEDVIWEDPPEMDEAGTPVIIGVVALMEAINVLKSVGWDAIIKHEAALTAYALKRLKEIPDIRIYCKTDESLTDQQLGVIPFNLGDIHHALVSAVLSYEGGIGVRNGCFCAHPFILYLMEIPVEEALEVREMIIGGDRSTIPGLIRMSFGCYNNESEVDELIDILKIVKDEKYIGEYEMDPVSGNCFPKGYSFNFDKYFKL